MNVKIKRLTLAAILSLLLCPNALQAMQEPAIPEINEKIVEKLEKFILEFNEMLSPAEKEMLDEMIRALYYSKMKLMTDEDFARFSLNRKLMDTFQELRQYYLEHLQLKLDYHDNIYIDVKMTWWDIIKLFGSFSEYTVKKVWPRFAIMLAEWIFYNELVTAWEKGDDYSHIITKMIAWPQFMWMALEFNDPIIMGLGIAGWIMLVDNPDDVLVVKGFKMAYRDVSNLLAQYLPSADSFWQLYNMLFPNVEIPTLENYDQSLPTYMINGNQT
ncbi:MAG TPA: hypothetical protein VEK06_03830 [Myxococcota bacterium]|nr:hypothetical protein [Myxococcota bacterium]